MVTRGFLLDERPDAIINIVDATNIERNLYLTLQLIDLDIPMVLALNMMDEVAANGARSTSTPSRRRSAFPSSPFQHRKERASTSSSTMPST